jgi:hypothetical protein
VRPGDRNAVRRRVSQQPTQQDDAREAGPLADGDPQRGVDLAQVLRGEGGDRYRQDRADEKDEGGRARIPAGG